MCANGSDSPKIPDEVGKAAKETLDNLLRARPDDHYILDANGEAVPFQGSLIEWAMSFERSERTIAHSNVGFFRVSTVFLGLNHAFPPWDATPLIFETMIFCRWKLPSLPSLFWPKVFWYPKDVGYQNRYATRAEALAGHEVAVKWTQQAHLRLLPEMLWETVVSYTRYGWWWLFRRENIIKLP